MDHRPESRLKVTRLKVTKVQVVLALLNPLSLNFFFFFIEMDHQNYLSCTSKVKSKYKKNLSAVCHPTMAML